MNINAILFNAQQNKWIKMKRSRWWKKRGREKTDENIADFAILIGRYVYMYPSCIVVISNYDSHKYIRTQCVQFIRCSTFQLQHHEIKKMKIVFWTSLNQRQDQYILLMVYIEDKSIYYVIVQCINKQTELLFSIDTMVHRMMEKIKS